MPKIFLTVPGVKESVTRPVVYDVVRSLMDLTGISHKTMIFYPGETEKISQVGGNISQPEQPNIFPFNDRITVEVDENHDPSRMISEAVFRPEYLALFSDEKIETLITPVYSDMETVINFKFRAASKDKAERWRDEIRAKTAIDREMFMHDIEYSYIIPEEMILILKEIFRMREAVAGYGDTWSNYLTSNSSNRITTLTTLAGTQSILGVAETQTRVTGYFDFEGVPEKGDRENDGDSWTISFSYKFTYAKPIGCAMSYPLMIHNQLLSTKYRPDEVLPIKNTYAKYYSLSSSLFAEFESTNKSIGIPSGFSIPGFDEFIPSQILPSTVRVVTVLCSIDTAPTANPNLLLSLTDLGDSQINPVIIDFLLGELSYLNQPYRSVFNLSLYEGIYLLPNSKVAVMPDYSVQSTFQLDPRKYYHVRLGLIVNFKYLDPAAVERLQWAPDALVIILDALGYKWNKEGVLKDKYVPRSVMNKIIEDLNRLDGGIPNRDMAGLCTVQGLSVEANRRQ